MKLTFFGSRVVIVALAGLLLTIGAPRPLLAQLSLIEPPGDGGRRLDVSYDSGEIRAVASFNGGISDPDRPQLVLSTEIAAEPGAPWLRLDLTETVLGGDHEIGRDAILRITSLEDGAEQLLDKVNLNRWRHRSAYFNGDRVRIEMFAYPGAPPSRVVVSGVDAAPPRTFTQMTLCGPDDRVPSTDPRAARLLPAGCTAFLIDSSEQCFLTAGHCADSDVKLDVVQFNVPDSNPDGSLNHPPPSDQYPVDLDSVQFTVPGIGNDWGYFGVFPNSNTGTTPRQAQGDAYSLASAAPPAFSQSIRITGYGVDSTPTLERRQTQQTSSGSYEEATGTFITYAVDTTGGNSGSPVVDETNGLVIGIHTHGGCSADPDSANAGTAIQKTSLQNALDNPQGVCALEFVDCNRNLVPDTEDIASGTSSDCNVNGVPDECEDLNLLADLNSDNGVDANDLGLLLLNWGTTNSASDLNDDGVVDGSDLGILLIAWGPPC